MATIKRTGFGQVEPNHLSAQRTGQIYAQLPADDTIEVLENGQFVKYDYADGKVCYPNGNENAKGEWMLVFNEVKLYDERYQGYKDFAMIKNNYTPGSDTITHYGVGPLKGQMVPRLFKTNVGDIYTTNCLEKGAKTGNEVVEGTEELNVGDTLSPDEATGYLKKTGGDETMKWQIVKVYTMPDGQQGVKLMRIA